MPRTTIRRINGDGFCGEFTYNLRSPSLQPVRVGENDNGTRVAGLFRHHRFIDRRDDLRFIAMWFRGSNERVRRCCRNELGELPSESSNIRGRVVLVERPRELRREVGNDAARFFYVMRSNEQHLDFDMQLATSRSNENPVYYIQYAHARVCSVLRQMREKGFENDPAVGRASLSRLTEPHERALLAAMSRFAEVVEMAALQRAPHALVQYLRELATDFHAYYNAHQFLVPEADLRNARLVLIQGVRQVVCNGLGLLGVSAPEAM